MKGGVEQAEVDIAVVRGLVGRHYGAHTAQRGLAVERSFGALRCADEGHTAQQLVDGQAHHQPAPAEHRHTVVEVLEVGDVVGGDDHRLMRLDGLGKHALQLLLRLDVEPCGGLVEEQDVGAERHHIGYPGLEALAHGERLQRHAVGEAEALQIALQQLRGEGGVKLCVDAHHLRDIRGRESGVGRQKADVAQHRGEPMARRAAVDGAPTRGGKPQPGDEVEQSGLAGAILAQQQVYAGSEGGGKFREGVGSALAVAV